MRLEGKVAIITGAASGIGKAAALLFAGEGAKVVIADVSEKGRDVVQQIIAKGGEAMFAKADVSKGYDVKKMVDKTVDAYGRLDVLFNNAGILSRGTVTETTEEEWEKVMAVNLKSVFLCSKHAMPFLMKSNGVVVNMASRAALIGRKSRAAYTASKGAIAAMTRAMAVDYAPSVRVNCICPGPVDTPMTSPKEAEERKNEVLLKRLGKPEEIANVALFLASGESSYVTGSVYTVDAGDTAT